MSYLLLPMLLWLEYSKESSLFQGLTELLGAETDIGVKRMGELDEKPFLNVCKQRYSANEATVEAATLCSTWQENLKNPSWHPFKREGTGDKAKVGSFI